MVSCTTPDQPLYRVDLEPSGAVLNHLGLLTAGPLFVHLEQAFTAVTSLSFIVHSRSWRNRIWRGTSISTSPDERREKLSDRDEATVMPMFVLSSR